jgi:hypothetical protein
VEYLRFCSMELIIVMLSYHLYFSRRTKRGLLSTFHHFGTFSQSLKYLIYQFFCTKLGNTDKLSQMIWHPNCHRKCLFHHRFSFSKGQKECYMLIEIYETFLYNLYLRDYDFCQDGTLSPTFCTVFSTLTKYLQSIGLWILVHLSVEEVHTN